MYLTRFRFNTARSEARRLLGSPHRLHGAVNMAFPEPPARDGDGPRVLWRLDHTSAGRVDLFVSSPSRPDLTHLVEQAGWPSLGPEGWTTFAYAEFLDALRQGDTWAFRLTANPVHHIRRESDPPGAPTKRAAHVSTRHQIGWLLKHQERAGFAVVRRQAEDGSDMPGEEHEVYELIVHDRTPVRFGKPSGTGPAEVRTGGVRNGRAPAAPDVRFTRATYDGRLRITDLTAFRHTLTHGLGKAKAYGCGLMTLAPVR
ncbi:type I-E CRISPR-associated protein Cas6/Cse3/CasE [Streptomyces palmae]|uniref:Type I-E CRISPR-associated protein Cas6/Cse3/CasE n=1 Tax=Streptomyces palmae TaxID=1701085 RepID=A0A4Z0HG11_9ACTN|nr:type I-E CRISPR-associated protein Cas6/Cse3/CasE [Streptomyces palmae]TGB17812.1 type I-E CRISPR-associated protein Cas6/Cse3/CasE [Streptomyces palmae]